MLNKVMLGVAIIGGITGAATIYIAKTKGDVIIGIGSVLLAAGAVYNVVETGRV